VAVVALPLRTVEDTRTLCCSLLLCSSHFARKYENLSYQLQNLYQLVTPLSAIAITLTAAITRSGGMHDESEQL
jgi:hypothetical protein